MSVVTTGDPVRSTFAARSQNHKLRSQFRDRGPAHRSARCKNVLQKSDNGEPCKDYFRRPDHKLNEDGFPDTATAVTNQTCSEVSFSVFPQSLPSQPLSLPVVIETGERDAFQRSSSERCATALGDLFVRLICIAAFCSPLIMILLPKVAQLFWMPEWRQEDCGPKCDGLLLGLVFKLIILSLATWHIFVRRRNVNLARVQGFRVLVLSVVILSTFCYWLFYVVKIVQKREEDYYGVVMFGTSLLDTLLCIHYLAVIVLELRHLRREFIVQVVRSPDGEARSYTLGQMSIQCASAFILEQYYKDFPRVICAKRLGKQMQDLGSLLKGSIDRQAFSADINGNSAVFHLSHHALSLAANSDKEKITSLSNDRLQEELEHERQIRKRKTRLISVTEQAFQNIKRCPPLEKASLPKSERSRWETDGQPPGNCILNVATNDQLAARRPLSPHEIAQAVFPKFSRALYRYFCATNQQHVHTFHGIMQHLAHCIAYDGSANTFLQRYTNPGPQLFSQQFPSRSQKWSLVCAYAPNSSLTDQLFFQLCQGQTSLFVTVGRIPRLSIVEQAADLHKRCFLLQNGSETSV